MTSSNAVVNLVACRGVMYNRMFSLLGHNAQLCSDRHKCRVSDSTNFNFSISYTDSVSKDITDTEMHNRSITVWELLFVMDGLGCLSDWHFSDANVLDLAKW